MMTHVSFLVLHMGVVVAIGLQDPEDLVGTELWLGLSVMGVNFALAIWRLSKMFAV